MITHRNSEKIENLADKVITLGSQIKKEGNDFKKS